MAAVAANGYFMADKTISRKHLIIEVAGVKPRGCVSLRSNSESIAHSRQTKLNVRPEIVLQDLGTKNGTLVNGFAISGRYVIIEDRNKIRLGGYKELFQ